MESTSCVLVAKPATVHFQLVSDYIELAANLCDPNGVILPGCGVWELRHDMKIRHFLPRQLIFALQIALSDLDVGHGHVQVPVAENLL